MKNNVLTESVYRRGVFRFRFRLVHNVSPIAHICAYMISNIYISEVYIRINLSGRLVARSATYQGV